jgi:hypothetical protein
MDPVRQIADAVLYEGYMLWPYRRSALKNRRRWTFGGVYPRGHSDGRVDDPWLSQTQCLLEAEGEASLDVRVRFLHLVRRQVVREGPSGRQPVDELTVEGERHLSWEEATEREVAGGALRLDGLDPPQLVRIHVPAGSDEELLPAGAGAVVRSWESLEGELEIGAERLGRGLLRLTVRVSNTTPWQGGTREDALARTFCSAHAVLRADGAQFVSLTDPPEALRPAAERCRNDGVWPVLVGEPGERHTVLASPIILEDYPRVAPESPGDLFDGGEIDGLLTLNILSLTDEEKAEMRDSDPRAREILERTEALSEEELLRLHGAIREFSHVPDQEDGWTDSRS